MEVVPHVRDVPYTPEARAAVAMGAAPSYAWNQAPGQSSGTTRPWTTF